MTGDVLDGGGWAPEEDVIWSGSGSGGVGSHSDSCKGVFTRAVVAASRLLGSGSDSGGGVSWVPSLLSIFLLLLCVCTSDTFSISGESRCGFLQSFFL